VVRHAVATRSPRNVDSALIYEQRFLRRQMFEVKVPFGVAQVPDDGRSGHRRHRPGAEVDAGG